MPAHAVWRDAGHLFDMVTLGQKCSAGQVEITKPTHASSLALLFDQTSEEEKAHDDK